MNRLKSHLGRDSPTRETVNTDSIDSPHDVDDPTTFENGATPSLKERIQASYVTILTNSLLIIGVGVFTIYMTLRYAPGIVESPVVRRGVPIAAIALVLVLIGAKWMHGVVQRYDWLVLRYPKTVVLYLGDFQTTDDGARVFLPVRGFSLLGTKADHFTLDDVSDSFVQSAPKRDRDPDEPVRIALPQDDKAAPVADTWFGRVGHVVTDGLEPNAAHPHIDYYVTNSANDHETVVDELLDQLEKKTRRIETLEQDLEFEREQKEQYRELAEQTYEEARDEMKDDVVDIMTAQRNPSTLRDDDGSASGPSQNGSGGDFPDDFEEVVDEV